MKSYILAGLFVCGFLPNQAQTIWVNKGAVIYSNAGSLIQIRGGLQIDSAGLFKHGGEMILNGALQQDGQLFISGDITVKGDIQNNGEIKADSGTFELSGSLQTIAGTGSTKLFRLRLSGSETKHLEQPASARFLDLNDRILNTGAKKFYVFNGDPQAVTRISGYVTSDSGGALCRILLPGQSYLFPTGGEHFYVPVILKPESKTDTAGIRFAPVDPGQEGLSRNFIPEEICKTNDLFYNIVCRTDTGALNLQVFYPEGLSTPYRTLLSAGTADFVSWESRYPSTFAQQDTFLTVSARINGIAREAFLLGRKRPEQPVITGRDSICLYENAVYTADSEAGLSWTAGGAGLAVSGDSASVSSDQPGSAFIALTVSDALGCSSLPAKRNITVLPVPVAGISIHEPDYPYENQVWNLSYAGTGATGFTWYSEGEPSGSDTTWQVAYDAPGTYPVLLELVNEFGCKTIQDTVLRVFPGLEIPDAFSPNGDGINDELIFLNSGLIKFNLSIYNRWGNLVFRSNDPKFSWDGRDLKGEAVQAGTYFYWLDAALPGKQYKQHGSITVLF